MSICPRCAAPIPDNKHTCPVCDYETPKTATNKLGWRNASALSLFVLIAAIMGIIHWMSALQRRVPPESLIAGDVAFAAVIDGPSAWKTLGPLSREDSWVQQLSNWMRSTWQLDLGDDVMSWAGRIVIGAQVSNPFAPSLTFVVSIRDEQVASTTIERLRKRFEHRGAHFQPTPYEGVKIYSAQSDLSTGGRASLSRRFTPSFAIAGRCIIVASTESAVRAAIDRFRNKAGCPTLEGNPQWKRIRREFSKKASIVLAFDPEQLIEKYTPLLLTAMGEPPGKPRAIETASRLYRGFGWLALAVEMDRESVHISVPGVVGNGVLRNVLQKSESVARMDSSALGLIPSNALGFFIQRFTPDRSRRWFEAARSQGMLPSAAARARGRRSSDRNVSASDISDLLDGDAACVFLPTANGTVPRVVLILSLKSESSRRSVSLTLRDLLKRLGYSLLPSRSENPVIERASIPAQAITGNAGISKDIARTLRQALSRRQPSVDIAVSATDRFLLIASDDGPIKAVFDASRSGDTIERNHRFQSMKSYMGKGDVSLGYVDVASVTEHCVPGGPLIAFAFAGALNAIRQIDGILICGTVQDNAFRYDIHVGANMKQLSDIVRESNGPVSLLLQRYFGTASLSHLIPSFAGPAMGTNTVNMRMGYDSEAQPMLNRNIVSDGFGPPPVQPRDLDAAARAGMGTQLFPRDAWPTQRDDMVTRGPTNIQPPGIHIPGGLLGVGPRRQEADR